MPSNSLSLSQLQSEFRSYLLGSSETLLLHLESTPERTVTEWASIYLIAYQARLQEVLMQDFSTLHQLMGDDSFEELTLSYLQAYPSHHFSVRYFGQHLPLFLRSTIPYSDQSILGQTAEWEWLAGEVFDALDQPSIASDGLSSVAPDDWATLVFHFHPSLRRVDLGWNIPQLWRAIKQEVEVPTLQKMDPLVAWVLWRQDLNIHFRSLTDIEAWAFDQASQGMAFGDLCEGLCEWINPDEVVAFMTNQLSQWFQSQWVTGFSS